MTPSPADKPIAPRLTMIAKRCLGALVRLAAIVSLLPFFGLVLLVLAGFWVRVVVLLIARHGVGAGLDRLRRAWREVNPNFPPRGKSETYRRKVGNFPNEAAQTGRRPAP